MGGDVREPERAGRCDDGRRQGVRHFRRRRKGLGGAESARQVSRQDCNRGRSHQRHVRRQRLFRLGAIHREHAEWIQLKHLLRPLDRSWTDVLEPDEAEPDDPRYPIPGHLGDR